MRTEQEYRNLEEENTRLAAKAERLKQELDEALLIHQTDTGTESVVATLQAHIDGLEADCAARKAAQESLEQYNAECTRLQHEVDRLKGEGAVDQSERV